MADNRIYFLRHDTARKLAAAQCMLAQDGWVVRFSEPTRNLEQNAKLHAVLTDIADQVIWMGQKLPMEVWKRLCMASWLREAGEQPMLIPALDGNGFDVIFERTSKLTVRQMAELIEWCLTFGAERNVVFHDELEAA